MEGFFYGFMRNIIDKIIYKVILENII
jgi:hypothetical protein